MEKTTVVNVQNTSAYDAYVGRGHAPHSGKLNPQLGNPFRIGQHGTRADVLTMYARYFTHRIATEPDFKARIEALRGKKLGCWCDPLGCHAHIIAAYLNSEVNNAGQHTQAQGHSS